MPPSSSHLPARILRLALFGLLLLASCSSTTHTPPSSGMAVIDATPDSDHRDRIAGIRLVSINGQAASGTEHALTPGPNRVRLHFKWPQGGSEDVDLDFEAKAGTIYAIHYDVHPPYTNRLKQAGMMDDMTQATMEAGAGAGEAAFLLLAPLTLFGSSAVAARVGNEVAEGSRPANYVDVRVVAQRKSQGVACTLRVFPDGRTEKR